jgi:CMP-N-acetylneuraminic acid synthetase
VTTLALVPARGGSRGIPGKNTRDFAGKPLLAWAIETGRAVCDRTFVSTDDPGIGMVAATYMSGVLLRPHALATDEAPMLPVLQHALRELEPWQPDVVVLLQPTAPLRTAKHVQAALQMLEETGASTVVSVVEIPAHYSPDYAMHLVGGRWLEPWRRAVARRQDARTAYSRDGTVYAIRRWVIEDGSLYGPDARPLVIPRSESANLDTEEDWVRAEALKRGA